MAVAAGDLAHQQQHRRAVVLGDVDTAVVVLKAASGAIAHISNSRRALYGYDQRIEVLGAHGMVEAGNWRQTTVRFLRPLARAVRM